MRQESHVIEWTMSGSLCEVGDYKRLSPNFLTLCLLPPGSLTGLNGRKAR